MRLRPRRGNLVIWSSSGGPDGGSWAWRPARARRIRWWLRTGTLLALMGVVRLARTARIRWEPVFLGVGVTLVVIGFALPAAWLAFLFGLLVLVVTLLKGIATKGRRADQAADCWQWRG
jgi:hypothetical protein